MNQMSRGTRAPGLRGKATRIDKILAKAYGEKNVCLDEDPVDTLVETILSQNTTDVNSHRSFRALKAAYSEWQDLLGEDPKVVSGIIRSGGLPDMKAERILGALDFIMNERGRIELDFLRDMTPQDADMWLAQMKGVGPKTRAIVLLFSLGMPSFPVDTHVHRVTRRLGLIGPRTSREDAQEELAAIVSPGRYFTFHVNLIEHGRRVCRARRPMCGSCVLACLCDNPAGQIGPHC